MAKQSEKGRGHMELELMDGMSPRGYVHNPDYLTITVWENKASFDVFYKENLEMNHSSVEQVNQFQIK
jgi:heme-degrading monooxygenase HmoA